MEDDEDMSPAGSITADSAGWPIEDATTSDFHLATPAPSDATGLPIAEDATTSDFYLATPAPSDATGLPMAGTLASILFGGD